MLEFKIFIDNMEVLDLPMMGRRFTWTNFQDNAIHNRLDRFLVSLEWVEKFNIAQWGLARPISDHCPVMIHDGIKDWGLHKLLDGLDVSW